MYATIPSRSVTVNPLTRLMRKKQPHSEPPAATERDGKTLDERVRRSRAAVIGATTQLLVERGFGGATVDEISRRSGVAKTTIYRHWPTRIDLLRDACSTLGTPLDTPDNGSFEADATALVTKLAQLLRSAKWTSVLPSIIDAAERDPDIADMYGKLQESYSAPFGTLIQRALRRGELPANTDVATLIAALTGPLFYRRWFSREPLTDEFAREIVRRVVRRDYP
jgi:AcrR family transcriptional regulator